ASTVQAGLTFAAAPAVGVVAGTAAELARGALPAISIAKWKLVAAAVFLVGLLGTGTGWLIGAGGGGKPAPPATGNPGPDNVSQAAANRSALFDDITLESGIQFTYHNGEEANHYSILESLGGGVALLDYDGDGLLDIVVTGGGYFGGKDQRIIVGH